VPDAPLRFGIIAGRFNREISERLAVGARAFLRERGIPASRIREVWVPGAFELPVAALKLARSGQLRAVIAVGCILRGETPQYRHLADAVMHGLMTASLLSGVPVASGVVVASSWKQAVARSRGKRLHRGREAAQAAWTMAGLFKGK